jgi:hypothetical protein
MLDVDGFLLMRGGSGGSSVSEDTGLRPLRGPL